MGTRVYAIGDIHGRRDMLEELHEQIIEDAHRSATPHKVAVYLGDYVDRGPDSREVVDYLIQEPLPGFTSVHLMGNHEARYQIKTINSLHGVHEDKAQLAWEHRSHQFFLKT